MFIKFNVYNKDDCSASSHWLSSLKSQIIINKVNFYGLLSKSLLIHCFFILKNEKFNLTIKEGELVNKKISILGRKSIY